MRLRLQIIVGVLLVASLMVIGNMVRKRRLELKYALVWFLVGGVVLVFDIFPKLLNWLSDLMGVGLPVNMLFFLGFVFSLLIIFSLTVSVSKLSERVKRMAQEMALLEESLGKRKEEGGSNAGN